MMETFARKRSTQFLGVLLLVDAIFIVIHLLHELPVTKTAFPVLNDPFLSLTQDLGYAEFFQYIKEIWIALMLMWVAVRGGGAVYGGWAALFLFFFLDDSVQIHETLGAWVARVVAHVPFLQSHAQDVGEVFVVACIGLLFVVLITLAHRRSDSAARRESRHLVFMVSLLVFFGVIFDFIHALFAGASKAVYYGMGMIEDSGEMLVMSVICWYVFQLCADGAPER
jgi:hypothetical protein